jgi:hypothetical protein
MNMKNLHRAILLTGCSIAFGIILGKISYTGKGDIIDYALLALWGFYLIPYWIYRIHKVSPVHD